MKLRSGLFRLELPATSWRRQPLSKFLNSTTPSDATGYFEYRKWEAPRFFFKPNQQKDFLAHFSRWDAQSEETPVQRADDVAQGVFRFFEHADLEIGCPPDWHRNAFTGQRGPARKHWSEIDDFDFGDIKAIWEPNRFAFVYPLVKAYWRTGKERYAELFWQLLDNWRNSNRPQSGVNWKCGQEISLRVMAWCFAFYGFLESKTTTPERIASLAQMIAVSGERIEANLSYALQQQNNHGISEAMSLWTIGMLFPEFRRAGGWRDCGEKLLESQARSLIYDDGTFCQHSANYQRLMLHDYLWSVRLGELHGQPFSPELRERVELAGQFLFQLQDEDSGQLACFGQNDGSCVLPLSNCEYRDFRPVIQATQYLSQHTRCYEAGPWDEDLLWLFGPEACEAEVSPPERIDMAADTGGYYTLRSPVSFVSTHCGGFQHRPSQADLLHVDLWWQGQNIAIDPGSYSYNAPAPWSNPLAETAFHNTVTVDDCNQMERASRFLWLPWCHGESRPRVEFDGPDIVYWEGTHDGYRRLGTPVTHRRGILRLHDEHWLIVDRLDSRNPHNYRLHWLLNAFPYTWDPVTQQLTLKTEHGNYSVQIATSAPAVDLSCVVADESSPRGWQSRYYNQREPAISLAADVRCESAYFWTVLGPGNVALAISERSATLQIPNWTATIELNVAWAQQLPLIETATLRPRIADRKEAA